MRALINPKIPCPICGAIVPMSKPIGKPYECASCHAKLLPSLRRSIIQFDISLLGALVAAIVFHRGGWAVLGWALVYFVPLFVLVTALMLRLKPPAFAPYDGKRIVF